MNQGCDIYRMMQWLSTAEGQRTVGNKDFLLISLGTNDVGRYGVDVSLSRCSEIISFIRQSFPGIRAIGWLALSPRWKPTRFVSSVEIGREHNRFNERLQVLSKQLDFDVVDARLGPSDMRVEDGLHPSSTTGRWKYEEALRNWFSSRAVARYSSSPFQPEQSSTTILNNNDNRHYRRDAYNVNHHYRHNNFQTYDRHRHQNQNTRSVTTHNSTQPFIVTENRTVNSTVQRTVNTAVNKMNSNAHPCFPSRALIKFYPHKLRTKEQYFRENEPVKELENEKDKLFLAANFYYQMRYFEEESKKWKIYEAVASRKKDVSRKDGDDVLMEEIIEIPIARPFAESDFQQF